MRMYNFLCSDSLLYFFLFLSTLHSVYTRDCSCNMACGVQPNTREYKFGFSETMWCYHPKFLLTVDPIPDNGIRTIQSTVTKFIKKWLRLPRNATQAILFHPEALNFPHLPTERVKAKGSQIATISTSCDTRTQEINFNLSTPSFVKALHISNEAVNKKTTD